MTRSKIFTRLKIAVLIISVLMLAVITQSEFTAVGQSDTAKIKGKVTDVTEFAVGESVQFEIEINKASDAVCEDGAWTLEFGDGRSTSGKASGTRPHTYLRVGVYNAVLNYAYFENVGTAAPDCQPRTAVDSVPVNIVEAEVQPVTARFVGSDGNWFEPSNWSTGRVPGEGDSVELDGDAHVVIDPELDPRTGTSGGGSGKVDLQDFNLLGNAVLQTLEGSELSVQNLTIESEGGLGLQSSSIDAQLAIFRLGEAIPEDEGSPRAWGCHWCTLSGNPSLMTFEDVSFENFGIELLLGGPEPATDEHQGVGYYANIRSESISFANTSLSLGLIYDFEPQAGDEFVIIEASESLTGTFSNLEDGDVVLTTDDVNIMITYTDTQIILTAEEL